MLPYIAQTSVVSLRGFHSRRPNVFVLMNMRWRHLGTTSAISRPIWRKRNMCHIFLFLLFFFIQGEKIWRIICLNTNKLFFISCPGAKYIIHCTREETFWLLTTTRALSPNQSSVNRQTWRLLQIWMLISVSFIRYSVPAAKPFWCRVLNWGFYSRMRLVHLTHYETWRCKPDSEASTTRTKEGELICYEESRQVGPRSHICLSLLPFTWMRWPS